MPRGGVVEVRIDDVAAASRPGRHVCMTVRDSGCGIAPEIQPRIFEPYFTTKSVGKGTGLGLATVFGIVQQHGGWIEVDSVVDRGTAFRLFFPAVPLVT
jgi:signal transduction histidine kinase